jgi:hypothetical protein
MAHRELYERGYDGGIHVALLKIGNETLATVTGAAVAYTPPAGTTVTDAKREVDRLIGAAGEGPWRQVMECFVCLARPVAIAPVHERDAVTVDCPNCGHYRITGVTATACHRLHDEQHGRQQLADVARYMRATTGDQNRDSLSTDSFPYFEQEGRRLRGR